MFCRLCPFRILLFLIFTSAADLATGQDTVLTASYKGSLDSIHSNILSQTRLVQVFVPPDYTTASKEKYDVIYVLDGGNWNTGLLNRTQHFIEDNGQMPPTIVVSVMGIDRNVELTPTHLDSWNAPTGGADKFLGYIKNELIPYINKKYPSDGENTLWGHSLGGMFVIYALLKEPAAFKSYIAVDPSMWWDNSYVAKLAAAKLPALTDSAITLYVSGRLDRNFHDMKVDTLEAILKEKAPANLKWKVVAYPDESHSSVRFKTIYDGLKYTYQGYTGGISFLPENGTVLKDKPYNLTYFDDSSRVYYTVDGSVPTETSPQVKRGITITGPATVTYKRYTNRSSFDRTATGHFSLGKASMAVPRPKKAVSGGFGYAWFEGQGDKWPDLKTAQPVKVGITGKSFDTALSKNNNHILVIDGYLEIQEDGYYTFFLRGETGSKLSVGGNQLMLLDEKTINGGSSYLVPLSKGFYPLHLEEFDKKDQFNFVPYYITPSVKPGEDPILIPENLEYSSGKQ